MVKTITVTEDAYNALKGLKRRGESFSKVILRVTDEKTGLPEELFGAWKDDEGLKERVMESRRRADEDAERRAEWIRRKLR